VVSLAVDDPYWPNLACASDRAFSALMAVPSVPVGAQCLAAFACAGADDEDWVLVHDARGPT
jgi:2-C-methyl-D-erythritol 4-phosphate cytidylyltransferase